MRHFVLAPYRKGGVVRDKITADLRLLTHSRPIVAELVRRTNCCILVTHVGGTRHREVNCNRFSIHCLGWLRLPGNILGCQLDRCRHYEQGERREESPVLRDIDWSCIDCSNSHSAGQEFYPRYSGGT